MRIIIAKISKDKKNLPTICNDVKSKDSLNSVQKRILIIDDEEDINLTVRTILENNGLKWIRSLIQCLH